MANIWKGCTCLHVFVGVNNKDDEVKIETFLSKHRSLPQTGDILVKELRYIIPLLVMYCFGIKDSDRLERKGK